MEVASMSKSIVLEWCKEPDIAYGPVKFHHVYHDYPTYHGHDFYEFFLCTQGCYQQLINEKRVVFKRLDACLLGLSSSHKLLEDARDSAHYSIGIRKDAFESVASFLEPLFVNKLEEEGHRCFSVSEARMKKIISYLNQIRETSDCQNEQDVAVKLLLFNLLEPLLSQSDLLKSGTRPTWLNDLLIEINSPEHLAWDVSDVVAHSNYSKTHLARLFREEMGKSIGEYLQEVKINNARDILVNSDMSLAELCDLIGHSSLSHFSNVFKRYYGMAPGKYRAAHKPKE